MERQRLDVLLPMLYGLAVVVCAIWVQGALAPVAIVGALLLGIYYAAFRGRMIRDAGVARPRSRDRDR